MIDDPIGSNLSDEELLAIKGTRGGGRYLPPGGGGPGPGPGGGFGGAGSGFFGSGMANTGVQGFGGWPKRKVVRGPNGDIQVALSPLDSSQDTVPAMLSPGEFVVNRNSVAMPGVKPMLEQLNMAGGGSVPGGSPMYELGRQMGMAMRGYACGGEVKPHGYAFGGVVRQQGGFNRTPQTPLGAPRMPAQPVSTVGTAPRQGAAPIGQQAGFIPGAPTSGTLPGAGPQPISPWQEGAAAPGSPNPGDEWTARINQLLKMFGQQGAFDLNGNPALLQQLRSEAGQNADALRARAALNAQALGLDAGQRGAYAMQSDLNTQGGVANTLNDAMTKLLLQNQGQAWNLLNSVYGNNADAWKMMLAKWAGGQ